MPKHFSKFSGLKAAYSTHFILQHHQGRLILEFLEELTHQAQRHLIPKPSVVLFAFLALPIVNRPRLFEFADQLLSYFSSDIVLNSHALEFIIQIPLKFLLFHLSRKIRSNLAKNSF